MFLKVSITSPFIVSNVLRISDFTWQVTMCCEVPLCFCAFHYLLPGFIVKPSKKVSSIYVLIWTSFRIFRGAAFPFGQSWWKVRKNTTQFRVSEKLIVSQKFFRGTTLLWNQLPMCRISECTIRFPKILTWPFYCITGLIETLFMFQVGIAKVSY